MIGDSSLYVLPLELKKTPSMPNGKKVQSRQKPINPKLQKTS
jgi:hypothetical protein